MSDFKKSIIALVLSVIGVHLVYLGYIRPEADLALSAAADAGLSAPRDIVVLIKDYEQEICFILMFWGGFLILNKCFGILRSKYLFTVDIVEETPEEPLDAEKIYDKLGNITSKDVIASPLVRTLRSALWRYIGTDNIQNLSDAIESSIDALAMRQEAENSMIRYLIWAIPSIGFIGTVRGIGQALSLADQALAGDISGMTDSLGVAFNSTLVALLISIFLMFLFHQLQRLQDGLLVDTQDYCEEFLIKRLK